MRIFNNDKPWNHNHPSIINCSRWFYKMHADLNKKEGNTNILKTMALRLQTKEKPLLINKIFCFKQKALKNKDMYDVRMYYLIDSANTSILNNNVNNNVNNVNTKIKLNLDDDRHIFI